MNSFLTNVATPSDANDAANKKYVDSKVFLKVLLD
nr:MAG TPA: tail fiber protein [Bacteriophage sp.]